MSILSAIKETQHENNNLDELARLPQALIMQMAQRGEIQKDMVMPILGKKAEMVEEAAKMKAAQTLAAQGGVQPTVMEQYMGKIAQAENPIPAMPQQQMPQQIAQAPMPQGMENAGVAQLPIPERNYAGGGIIAFSGEDNSYVDPEEETYRKMVEDAREEAEDADIYDMIANLKGSSGNAGVGITAGHRGAERGMEGDLDARLHAIIKQKESGGRDYDQKGNPLTSSKGAKYAMQVLDTTAKDPGFGIKPARDTGPNEYNRVGSELASALLRRYQDPKLAMIAYNYGSGNTDKWLAAGGDPNKLPKETQGYIRGVSLAGGGEVQHYAEGDYVGFGEEVPYDPESSWGLLDWWKRNTPGSKEFVKALEDKKNKTTPAKTAAAPTQAPAPAPRTDIPQSPEGIKNLQAQAKEEGFDFMNYIKNREAKMEKAAEQDKWLAGLSAGLGMLGGTSPYAMANIGQGGQMGVQQMAASQRGRAAQEASLGTLYGAAAKSDLMNKLRRDQLTQGGEQKTDKLNQDLQIAKNAHIDRTLKERGMDMTMLGNLRMEQATLASEGKTLDPKKLARLNYFEKSYKDIMNDANKMFANPKGTPGVIKLP